jgi:hypothetical protein
MMQTQTILFAVPQSRWRVYLAKSIAGSLGSPSKMPGLSWGISPKLCKVGQALAKISGSTCEKCYAMRDNYTYPSVQTAHDRRAAGLDSVSWRDAMIYLIRRTGETWFRWFDAGDLQSFQHLLDIVAIAEALPAVNFWLPTREKKLVIQYEKTFGNFPKNLCVRLSAAMIDAPAPAYSGNTSTVTTTTYTCAAPDQDGKCRDCRDCWNTEIKNVAYLQH